MKSLKLVLAIVALIAVPQTLAAQHGGHGETNSEMEGTGCAGHFGGPEVNRSNSIQATDEQARNYRAWLQATKSARTYIQQLHRATIAVAEYARQKDELQGAIADACQSQQQFLSSLTPEQRLGLKERVRKAEKTQAEVNKRMKTLSQALSRGGKSAEKGEKLDQALANWQAILLEIASEMGIQGESR